jgi:hypothetical protein
MGRKDQIITRKGMSVAEGALWAFAIVMTLGLAYPAYRARKHKLDRTSRTYVR